MEKIKTVSVLSINHSYLVYLPKVWAKQIGLKKGDKVSWHIKNDQYEQLILKGE